MNIGAQIKYLRQLNNLDQKQLAKKLNVSSKTISSWEVNRTQPKMDMIELMCDIFNCNKSDFLGDCTEYLVTKSEYEFIIAYRNADPVQRYVIKRILETTEKSEEEEV